MADTEKTDETEPTDAAEAPPVEDTDAPEATAAAGTEVAAEEAAEPEATGEVTGAEGAAEETAETEPAEAAAETEPAIEAPEPETTAEAADASEPQEAATAEPAAPEPEAPQHTFEELKGKTVAQLREIAEGVGDVDALHGYTTMHKEELLVALCKALGIEAHEHHEVVGIDKAAVKAKIRALKQEREALIAAKDAEQLKIVRRRIRSLKRKIHKATV